MPSEPLLLPLGALAFYLLDSLLMLYGNEVLLVATGRDGWRFAAGSEWMLGGRRALLPNPFVPWQPAWRLAWRGDEAAREPAPRVDMARLGAQRAALRPLGVIVVLLQWLMLPGLALELLLAGTGGALLLVLAAIYALVLAAGATVLLMRARLGLATRAALGLAIEGLLCPPFAINLARKVGLRTALADDPLELAARLGPAETVAALRAKLLRDAGPRDAGPRDAGPHDREGRSR
jgi:hypothetical protein